MHPAKNTPRLPATAAWAARFIVTLAIALPSLRVAAAMPGVSDLPVRAALPDPLIAEDGTKVATVAQWNRRRKEMERILEYYETGRIPPAPGNVTGRELYSTKVMHGRVTYRLVRLAFGPGRKLQLDVALLIPDGTRSFKAPFPVIVQPCFTPVSAAGAACAPADKSGKMPAAEPPEKLAGDFKLPLKRGYAVATFYYQQCGADRPDFRHTGFLRAYPGYDWGTLAAWAWGMSRCVDYLETQPFADRREFIALGHSRLGKAALVAGAFDTRFALVAPAGSGCGGTGAYRFNGKGRGGKEGLEDAAKNFPQWFGPRLSKFSGHVDRLPFDQHWLIALVAPRPFIAADALGDPYANGNALAQSWLAAKPVYRLLGVPGRLGINFRPGGHRLDRKDWQAILDFSDQQLRGMNVKRRFDQLPPAKELH